jgi:hypothetical protein
VDAGTLDEEGAYPEDSVNERVQARLRDLAERLKAFGREPAKEPMDSEEEDNDSGAGGDEESDVPEGGGDDA